jgi:flagellar biosynthesis protein FliR
LNALNDANMLAVFLVFCRVGTASMLLPGFAIARVPLLFRVLLGFMLSASAYPFLQMAENGPVNAAEVPRLIANELVIGLYFGFLCACFAYAVRFAANFIMTLVGLAGIPGQPIDDLEPNPPFAMFLSMAFTALVYATDLHLVGYRALIQTYNIFPLGRALQLDSVIVTLGNTLHDTSLMALQASSPFILHSLGINFALGLLGKLTPQLQVYFALMGISTLVALLALYVIGSPLLSFMVSTYASWLETAL